MARQNRPDDGLNAYQRYQQKLDCISIRPKLEDGERIRAAADLLGMSNTQFILKACTEYIKRHKIGLSAAQPAGEE